MPRDFSVTADIRPGRVRISWIESGAATRPPGFRLVRRRAAFPRSVDDGFTVVDIDALVQPLPLTAPWAKVERMVCIATNSGAEGGLLLGMLEVFSAPAVPGRAIVTTYDASAHTLVRTEFTEVSRVVTAAGPPTPPFTTVQSWNIFERPGSGAEVDRGYVRFLEGPPGNEMRWQPNAGTPRGVKYDRRRYEVTALEAGVFKTRVDGATLRQQLAVTSTPVPEAGVTDWRFTIDDDALEPGVVYYYRLFRGTGDLIPELSRGTAFATGTFGAQDMMYELLPPIYQVRDVDPTRPGGGRDLHRFLESFGNGIDHLRSLIDGIATRHDVFAARADLLPHLSSMIGWMPDLTVPEYTQRQDIRHAPALFGSVGTRRNAPALINRVTSWPTRVKEYVHNVFLTNAPEEIPIWEIWRVTRGGGVWDTPAPFALTTTKDGGAVALDTGTTPWVIWHSDRSGRRELWFQRPGVDSEPQRVMEGASEDGPGLAYSDEAPAAIRQGTDVRLFWTSNRETSRDIWTRLLADDATPDRGVAERLTEHPREDRHPAVVQDGAHQWLFWDSDRRGPRDIWHMRGQGSGATWGTPARLLKDPLEMDTANDSFPAAVGFAGNVWLFWCRDIAGRREIWYQILLAGGGGVAGPQQPVATDVPATGRDEAPWPVVVAGRLWLLFHSNRGGRWQIWTRVYDTATGWAAPTRLSAEPSSDKEPSGYVDSAGVLHVYWTSQRRTRWYKSRTFDVNDAEMLAELGTFNDHAHYSYDFGRDPDDWYARDTVGLWVQPDTGVDDAHVGVAVERAKGFLEPFRPAPVRYVWPFETSAAQETLADDTLVHEEWFDDIT